MKSWIALLAALLLSASAVACAGEAEAPAPHEPSGMVNDPKRSTPRLPADAPSGSLETTKAAPLPPSTPQEVEDTISTPESAPSGSTKPDPVPESAAPDPTIDPEPTLSVRAPAGGSYEIVTPEAMICSGLGDATSFMLHNASKETVEVLWLDETCAPRSYGTVKAGGSLLFQTYVSHRWRVRAEDGSVVGDYILRTSGSYDVTVR